MGRLTDCSRIDTLKSGVFFLFKKGINYVSKKKKKDKGEATNSKAETIDLVGQWKAAWDYYDPIRSTWEETEELVYSK
ncbi:hypothetical protein DRQ25_18350, partial [Candidatus Fermentibacteria bacterium]